MLDMLKVVLWFCYQTFSPTAALGGQATCAKVTLVPGTKPHENYSNSFRKNDSIYKNRIDGNLWLR